MISFIAEVLARLMYAGVGYGYCQLAPHWHTVDGVQPALFGLLVLAVVMDLLGGSGR